MYENTMPSIEAQLTEARIIIEQLNQSNATLRSTEDVNGRQIAVLRQQISDYGKIISKIQNILENYTNTDGTMQSIDSDDSKELADLVGLKPKSLYKLQVTKTWYVEVEGDDVSDAEDKALELADEVDIYDGFDEDTEISLIEETDVKWERNHYGL